MIASEREIMPNAITAQNKLWWMIDMLRASIAHDWAKLASEILTSDERRTITDRLLASHKALKEIKNTLALLVTGTENAASAVRHCERASGERRIERNGRYGAIRIGQIGKWGPVQTRRPPLMKPESR